VPFRIERGAQSVTKTPIKHADMIYWFKEVLRYSYPSLLISHARFLLGERIMVQVLKNARAVLSRILLVGAAGIVVVGCASKHPVAPTTAASPEYKYLIGPGDTVNIIVWRNPEISMSVPVRPDGRISAPLVEDLPAMGKDPSTLARDIEKELSKYIRDAVVTVVVTNFVGPYSEQIRVVGEAAKPQILAYKQKMTLLDVMIAVGGMTDFADGNGASILRTSDGNKQYGVRIKDLVKRGDVSANVEMMPGDVLIIPQSWF
jgi:polysaccharide biosynthesis/export protein